MINNQDNLYALFLPNIFFYINKGSRKKSSFVVARPLSEGGGGVKGLANKKKNISFKKDPIKYPNKCGH